MKTFIFTVKAGKKENIATIYHVKNNKPNYVGEVSYKPGSCPGSDSVVMQELIKMKYIPKSYYFLSQSSWRGPGYYCPEVEAKGIRIIHVE